MLLAAGLATLIRIMLQPLIPESESVLGPSVIVEAGLLIPVFTVYSFLVYLIMSYSFVILEERLPCSRMGKGLIFTACLGAIWMAYLFEPVPLSENSSLTELIAYPLADGISVLVLGLLLGRFVSGDTRTSEGERSGSRLILLLLPLVLMAIRLFEYTFLNIFSSYDHRPYDTMLWVAAMGLIIGVSYLLLGRGVPSSDPFRRSLVFGLLFYGIPIFLVNSFAGIALKIDWGDMVLRSALDVTAVLVSIYISERSAAGRAKRLV